MCRTGSRFIFRQIFLQRDCRQTERQEAQSSCFSLPHSLHSISTRSLAGMARADRTGGEDSISWTSTGVSENKIFFMAQILKRDMKVKYHVKASACAPTLAVLSLSLSQGVYACSRLRSACPSCDSFSRSLTRSLSLSCCRTSGKLH